MTEIRQAFDPAPARAARKPWLRPALLAGAVAAVAAVALTVAVPSGPSGAPAASNEAVALLEDIALAAEKSGAPDGIRDDQFVYIKSRDAYTTRTNGGPEKLDPVRDREIWLSVDGTREGLLEEDRPGNEHVPLEPDAPDNERATNYRALSGLPTDPDEMRDWLYRTAAAQVDAERPDRDHAAFVLFGDLIRESLMPPEVGAALYRAAAMIPGVEVVHGVRDSVGREGVAITRAGGDGREELIFDEKTFTFLGERVLDADGTVDGISAVVRRAVVDRAGERP
ncbi:CU044_5270 family protein [Streptomyces chromofuscus]|uniref:CU044_5270 family protein n=2 Tax=Streptomyces chromofuscus TaxID=42881 RepID=A0A7M2T0V9_STRCW|nr:CU044_5270 family protein [Streptomyces chromofuscus]